MPIQDSSSEFSAGWSSSFLTANSVYIRALLGTLVVDEAFLTEKFGEVTYLVKVDEFHPGGIIITDYVAEAEQIKQELESMTSLERMMEGISNLIF